MIQGQIYWDVTEYKITKYEYFALFPMKDTQYHILINRTSQLPERWYFKDLDNLIERSKGLTTYEEAREKQAELVLKFYHFIKSRGVPRFQL